MAIAGAKFHRWRPSAVLRVEGEDALSFLQGQFSNDLRELKRVPSVYGLWLNRKGKCLADSFVLRGKEDGSLLVVSYFSAPQIIRDTLEAHLVADDVAISDLTAETFGITWMGPEAGERAGAMGSGQIFPARRGAAGAREWIGSDNPSGEFGAELASDEMERIRIEAGVPAVPMDVGPADLPPEGGLDADAISGTKGCYLGQEVIARIKAMGQARRRLSRIRGPGARPPGLAKLYQGNRAVGEVRSTARAGEGFVGLAMLVLHHWQRSDPTSLSPGAAASIHVDSPP